jgi:gliding motility-associated-like protein
MKIMYLIGLIILSLGLCYCKKSKDTNNTTNHINCDGLITDTLGTGDNAKIYMPNAFTPNSDGLNDVSRPYTQNVTAITFTIYDGNNGVLFTTTTLGQGWTTSLSPDTWSTYYYKIQATTAGGHHIGKCGELYKLGCFPSSIPKSSLYFEDQLTPNGFTVVTLESMGTCP